MDFTAAASGFPGFQIRSGMTRIVVTLLLSSYRTRSGIQQRRLKGLSFYSHTGLDPVSSQGVAVSKVCESFNWIPDQVWNDKDCGDSASIVILDSIQYPVRKLQTVKCASRFTGFQIRSGMTRIAVTLHLSSYWTLSREVAHGQIFAPAISAFTTSL